MEIQEEKVHCIQKIASEEKCGLEKEEKEFQPLQKMSSERKRLMEATKEKEALPFSWVPLRRV